MTTEQLKQEIAKLFEKESDPEKIKQAAVVTSHIDDLKADEEKLVKQNQDLAEELKKAVLGGIYKPQHTAEETGSPSAPEKEVTLEECLAKVLAGEKKEG